MNLKSIREILRYPTVIVGVTIILLLIGISIYTVFAIPYDKAVSLWRGSEEDWYKNPKVAAPLWYNWFLVDKLPETKDIYSNDPSVTRSEAAADRGARQRRSSLEFSESSEESLLNISDKSKPTVVRHPKLRNEGHNLHDSNRL